jgi:hypothetical protein
VKLAKESQRSHIAASLAFPTNRNPAVAGILSLLLNCGLRSSEVLFPAARNETHQTKTGEHHGVGFGFRHGSD